MSKDVFLLLAEGYLNSYKRDIDFYELGKKTGIYVEFDNDPAPHAIEKVFDLYNESIVNALCDIAGYGMATVMDKDGWIATLELTTAEEVYDYFFGE